MDRDIAKIVHEAMVLSDRLETAMDGEDMYVILMALTKVAGVMLAESEGMSPDLADEAAAIAWFGAGATAAYRGHKLFLQENDRPMH
jgi:hypothetical protein